MKYFYSLLLCPFFLFAQTEFTTNSEFGIKADFAYSVNRDFSGVGGDLGVSFFNRVDFGFEYARISDLTQNDISSTGTIIYAAYNFKHKNNCLKVLAGYSVNSIESNYNFLANLDLSGPLLGVVISPRIFENESISLMPSLGFSMAFLSTSNESYNMSGQNHTISAGLEFNVISHINRKFHLIISPSVSKDLSNTENPLVVGFNLGVLFNAPKELNQN